MRETELQLNNIILTEPVKGIGETGLDYSSGFPDKKFQLPLFELHITQAIKHKLPLFIHERLAFTDCAKTLFSCLKKLRRAFNDETLCLPPTLIHCFTGTSEELKQYISYGFYVSISGFIKRTKAGEELRRALKKGLVPLDKLMIETDAPYMGFAGCRSDLRYLEGIGAEKQYPNVPAALLKVVSALAESLNLPVKEVMAHTTANAKKFFNIA
jgi:TatD DNase family protein